jgi:hypothetical protein
MGDGGILRWRIMAAVEAAIRVIQALLGHGKLETAARYTRVATGMISAVDSPLDHLGGRRGKRKKREAGKS